MLEINGCPYQRDSFKVDPEVVLEEWETSDGTKLRTVYLGELLLDCATVALGDYCGETIEPQTAINTAHDGVYAVIGTVTADDRLISVTIDLDCFGWLNEHGNLEKES